MSDGSETLPPIGLPELLFILLLALLLFGPRKLPELGRSLGRGLAEFRRASSELRATIEKEVRDLEQQTQIDSSPPNDQPKTSSYKPYDQTDRRE